MAICGRSVNGTQIFELKSDRRAEPDALTRRLADGMVRLSRRHGVQMLTDAVGKRLDVANVNCASEKALLLNLIAILPCMSDSGRPAE